MFFASKNLYKNCFKHKLPIVVWCYYEENSSSTHVDSDVLSFSWNMAC